MKIFKMCVGSENHEVWENTEEGKVILNMKPLETLIFIVNKCSFQWRKEAGMGTLSSGKKFGIQRHHRDQGTRARKELPNGSRTIEKLR